MASCTRRSLLCRHMAEEAGGTPWGGAWRRRRRMRKQLARSILCQTKRTTLQLYCSCSVLTWYYCCSDSTSFIKRLASSYFKKQTKKLSLQKDGEGNLWQIKRQLRSCSFFCFMSSLEERKKKTMPLRCLHEFVSHLSPRLVPSPLSF